MNTKKAVVDIACMAGLVFFDPLCRFLFHWSLFVINPNFDKVLHFATGILLADVYYCLPLKKNNLYPVVFVFGASVAWEFIEPFLGFLGIGEADFLFSFPWLVDTFGDIASAVAGGAICSFVKEMQGAPYKEGCAG